MRNNCRVLFYKFSIEEIRALARYLEHQWITQEDEEVRLVTRRIFGIVANADAQLDNRDSRTA
jgi:hypothetical protein